MRLLIADDDPIALELLKDSLADAGHEITCAEDGQEALDLLEKEEFHVVITDWEMPRLNRQHRLRLRHPADEPRQPRRARAWPLRRRGRLHPQAVRAAGAACADP